MNNIEELSKPVGFVGLEGFSLLADGCLGVISPNLAFGEAPVYSHEYVDALIAQLEAAQKERGVYAAIYEDVGAIITLLQGNEWAEHVAKTNMGGALEHEITRLINSITGLRDRAEKAEAELSAANEIISSLRSGRNER
ncbi:Uncharacterised protein [Yersinia kristensenii]|nr:Uncharacterised protein [Yersinia kristensenii]